MNYRPLILPLSLVWLLPTFALGQLVNKKPDNWSISVAYPQFTVRTVSAAHANKWARAAERKAFDDFLAQAKRDLPDLKRMRSSAQYELLVQPTVTLQSALVCSGYATSYAYTGGAHGMTYFSPINVTSTGKQLKLADLFVPKADSVGECSYAILGELLRQGRGSHTYYLANGNDLNPLRSTSLY